MKKIALIGSILLVVGAIIGIIIFMPKDQNDNNSKEPELVEMNEEIWKKTISFVNKNNYNISLIYNYCEDDYQGKEVYNISQNGNIYKADSSMHEVYTYSKQDYLNMGYTEDTWNLLINNSEVYGYTCNISDDGEEAEFLSISNDNSIVYGKVIDEYLFEEYFKPHEQLTMLKSYTPYKITTEQELFANQFCNAIKNEFNNFKLSKTYDNIQQYCFYSENNDNVIIKTLCQMFTELSIEEIVDINVTVVIKNKQLDQASIDLNFSEESYTDKLQIILINKINQLEEIKIPTEEYEMICYDNFNPSESDYFAISSTGNKKYHFADLYYNDEYNTKYYSGYPYYEEHNYNEDHICNKCGYVDDDYLIKETIKLPPNALCDDHELIMYCHKDKNAVMRCTLENGSFYCRKCDMYLSAVSRENLSSNDCLSQDLITLNISSYINEEEFEEIYKDISVDLLIYSNACHFQKTTESLHGKLKYSCINCSSTIQTEIKIHNLELYTLFDEFGHKEEHHLKCTECDFVKTNYSVRYEHNFETLKTNLSSCLIQIMSKCNDCGVEHLTYELEHEYSVIDIYLKGEEKYYALIQCSMCQHQCECEVINFYKAGHRFDEHSIDVLQVELFENGYNEYEIIHSEDINNCPYCKIKG